MPIYEYECPNCGERFELRRSIAVSDDEIKCPKCQVGPPRRLLSMFARSGGSSSGVCAPSSSG